MSLRLDGVGYTYSAGESLAQEALRDVSVEVSRGEVVLVAGPTGSGKSTLLRIASGLLAAAAGVAEIDGQPLSARSARGVVGIVFQNPEQQLFADSVFDDVAFGPRNLGFTEEDVRSVVADTLEAVGLDPDVYRDRSPFTLSGGQARRAAIAGVLAMRPRYVLLDEPTAGLDARGRDSVHEIIALARKASGIVIVSHDLDDMLPLADRVLLLDEGHPVFWGTGAQLIDDPSVFRAARLLPPATLAVQLELVSRGLHLAEFHLGALEAAQVLASACADCGSATRERS